MLVTQAKQVFYIYDPLDTRWLFLLAKQPKDYHRERLAENDNESLVAHENPTSHKSNSPLTYIVNNVDQKHFLREDGEGIWIDRIGNEK